MRVFILHIILFMIAPSHGINCDMNKNQKQMLDLSFKNYGFPAEKVMWRKTEDFEYDKTRNHWIKKNDYNYNFNPCGYPTLFYSLNLNGDTLSKTNFEYVLKKDSVVIRTTRNNFKIEKTTFDEKLCFIKNNLIYKEFETYKGELISTATQFDEYNRPIEITRTRKDIEAESKTLITYAASSTDSIVRRIYGIGSPSSSEYVERYYDRDNKGQFKYKTVHRSNQPNKYTSTSYNYLNDTLFTITRRHQVDKNDTTSQIKIFQKYAKDARGNISFQSYGTDSVYKSKTVYSYGYYLK